MDKFARVFLVIISLPLLLGCRCFDDVEPSPVGFEEVETIDMPEEIAVIGVPEEEKAVIAPEEESLYFYARVNDTSLKIKPADNSSAETLLELLKNGDVTVDMSDYGNFEKVGALGTVLPRNDEQITTEAGDVILYMGDRITIYYDVNTWNFTRLGKIQDITADELKNLLGDGNVTVTFSMIDKKLTH